VQLRTERYTRLTKVNMDINKYILQIDDYYKWSEYLSDWKWLIPNQFNIWLVNLFGDILYYLENDELYILDVVDGKIELLAKNRDEFSRLIDNDPEIFKFRFYTELIDDLVSNNKILKENEIYSFLNLPILGGEYIVSNVETTDIDVNYSLLGQIHSQIKDLPDGTKVKFELE